MRKSWRKIIIAALILAVVAANIGFVMPVASTEAQSGTTAENVGWQNGSSATACWDPVSGANYYAVRVFVYEDSTLLNYGSTGTSDTQLDVQQEINDILTSVSCEADSVEVTVRVTPQIINGNLVTSMTESPESERHTYVIRGEYSEVLLATPENFSVQVEEETNDIVFSWDAIEDETFLYEYKINVSITEPTTGKTREAEAVSVRKGSSCTDGVYTYDASNEIDAICAEEGWTADYVTISARIRACVKDSTNFDNGLTYRTGSFSETVSVNYVTDIVMSECTGPEDLTLSENLVATWTTADNYAEAYRIYLYYRIHNAEDGTTSSWKRLDYFSSTDTTLIRDDVCTVNLAQKLKQAYGDAGYTGEEVQFEISVVVTLNGNHAKDHIYYYGISYLDFTSILKAAGEETKISNAVNYSGNVIIADPPTNAELSEDLVATWTAPEQVQLLGEHAHYDLYYEIYKADGTTRIGYAYIRSITANDEEALLRGSCSYDLTNAVRKLCGEKGIGSETVLVSYRVRLAVDSGTTVDDALYLSSDYSDASSSVAYDPQLTLIGIEAPTEVTLSNNFKLSFVLPANYDRVSCFLLNCTLTNSAGVQVKNTINLYKKADCISENGETYTIDLASAIGTAFAEKFVIGDEVTIECSITNYMPSGVLEGDSYYYNLRETAYANTMTYDGRKKVEAITLSPQTPVVYRGQSLAIGKTISPIDAYYTSIQWSSEDTSIVTVDSKGNITGNAVGTANVTATIGNVSKSVAVTVYEISTNITDSEQSVKLKEESGDIISELCNDSDEASRNEILDKTDIEEEAYEAIRQDVLEGVLRGDTFYTDLVMEINEDAICSGCRHDMDYLMDDEAYTVLGYYHVEIEMYHVDSEGNKYHICNLTQLDFDLTFTHELPESFVNNLPELQEGYVRYYQLISFREHEVADDTKTLVNETAGTFSGTSQVFGDFALVYQDRMPRPAFSKITPVSGSNANAVTVTLTGDYSSWSIADDFAIYFGNTRMNYTISKGRVIVTVPAFFKAGTHEITVYNAGFKKYRLGTYTSVQYMPGIKSLTPTSGVNNNTITMTLTLSAGWTIGNDLTVYFGDTAMTTKVKTSNRKVTVTIPAGFSSGTYDIHLVNGGADSGTVGTYTSVQYVPPRPGFKGISLWGGYDNVANTVVLTMTSDWKAADDFKLYFGHTVFYSERGLDGKPVIMSRYEQIPMTCKVNNSKHTITLTVPAGMDWDDYNIDVYNEGVMTKVLGSYTVLHYIPPTPVVNNLQGLSGINNVKNTITMTQDSSWTMKDDFAVYLGDLKLATKVRKGIITATVPAGLAAGDYTIRIVNEGAECTAGCYTSIQYVYIPPTPTFSSFTGDCGVNNTSHIITLKKKDGWNAASDFAVYVGNSAATFKWRGKKLNVTIPAGLAAGEYDIKVYNEGVWTKVGFYTSVQYIPPTPTFSSISMTSGVNNASYTLIMVKKDGWGAAGDFKVYLGSSAVKYKWSGKKLKITIPAGLAAGSYGIYIYNEGVMTAVSTYTSVQYVPPTPIFTGLSQYSNSTTAKTKVRMYPGSGWSTASDFAVYLGNQKLSCSKKSKYIQITIPKNTPVGNYTLYVVNEGIKTAVGSYTITQ